MIRVLIPLFAGGCVVSGVAAVVAAVVIAAGATVAISMLVRNPGTTQLGIAAFLYAPVIAGEAGSHLRRQPG